MPPPHTKGTRMSGDRNIDVAAIRERLEATEKGAYTWGACGHEWTNLKDARALLDALDAARVEVERLQRWKAEAMEVLTGWEAVHEALGKPGRLGQSKSEASRIALAAIRADIAAEVLAPIEALADEYEQRRIRANQRSL